MHELGDGVPQDFHLAKRFFDQAAEIDSKAKTARDLALSMLEVSCIPLFLSPYASKSVSFLEVHKSVHSALGREAADKGLSVMRDLFSGGLWDERASISHNLQSIATSLPNVITVDLLLSTVRAVGKLTVRLFTNLIVRLRSRIGVLWRAIFQPSSAPLFASDDSPSRAAASRYWWRDFQVAFDDQLDYLIGSLGAVDPELAAQLTAWRTALFRRWSRIASKWMPVVRALKGEFLLLLLLIGALNVLVRLYNYRRNLLARQNR